MKRLFALISILSIASTARVPLAFSFGSSTIRPQKCTLTLPENLAPKGDRGQKYHGYGLSTLEAKKDAISACRFEVDLYDSTACLKASNEENEEKNMECGDTPESKPASAPAPAVVPETSPTNSALTP